MKSQDFVVLMAVFLAMIVFIGWFISINSNNPTEEVMATDAVKTAISEKSTFKQRIVTNVEKEYPKLKNIEVSDEMILIIELEKRLNKVKNILMKQNNISKEKVEKIKQIIN